MNDLLDRYMYAATKNMPHKTRADIGAELRGLVEDMLEERTGGRPATEQDLREVLAELGPPAELAEQYSPDKGRALISAPYFSRYKQVLFIALACVAFGLTVASLISAVVNPPTTAWYMVLWNYLGTLLMGLVNAFAFVTIIFAVFQRRGVQLYTMGFDLNTLPTVPNKKEEISRWESMFGIILSVLCGVVFIATPQIIGAWLTPPGYFVPVFNTAYLQASWIMIVLLAALGVANGVAEMYEGRHTRRLALITLCTDVASAFLYILLLGNPKLMNPEFLPAIAGIFTGEENFIVQLFSNFQTVFLAVILFALILDVGVTLFHALRSPK